MVIFLFVFKLIEKIFWTSPKINMVLFVIFVFLQENKNIYHVIMSCPIYITTILYDILIFVWIYRVWEFIIYLNMLVFIIIILCSYLMMMKNLYFYSLMKICVFILPKSAITLYLREKVFHIDELLIVHIYILP
jgi:hypothetical protein